MTAIRLGWCGQKSVDMRSRHHKMTPLAGHTERPQLAGQPDLTLPSTEKRLAYRTTGASHESIAFMPSSIQCRAGRLSNFLLLASHEWLFLAAYALESSVFSPSI
jgi:hypothetical protein